MAVIQMEFASSLENTDADAKDYEELLLAAAAYAFGIPADWVKAKVKGQKDADGDYTNKYVVTITYSGISEDTANSIQNEGSGELVTGIEIAITESGLPQPTSVTTLVDPITEGEYQVLLVCKITFSIDLDDSDYDDKNYKEVLKAIAATDAKLPYEWVKVEIEEEEDENGDSTGVSIMNIAFSQLTADHANYLAGILNLIVGQPLSSWETAITDASLPQAAVLVTEATTDAPTPIKHKGNFVFEWIFYIKIKMEFNMTDHTAVKNAINAFYKAAGLNLTFEGDVNARVAETFGEMIFATQKCSTALSWVPRPIGGKATISWIVRNFTQSVLRQIESKQSLTCAKEVVRNYRTKLQLSALGI
jgi:hypothetical protein